MIDDKQIQEAIAYYGGKTDPKREDAIALAACYILQDHLSPKQSADFAPSYSFAPPPAGTPQITAAPEVVGEYGSSDFLQAVAGKDPAACWGVIDGLMDDLAVINPRVYASVMLKIR